MNPNRKETIVRDEPGSCQECKQYSTCTEVCERVQLWSDQDYVGRNSNLVLENGTRSEYGSYNDHFLDLVNHTRRPGYSERDSDESQSAWGQIVSMRLSEKVSRFIYSYYMLGKRIRDIAIDEVATSQAIDQRRLQSKRSVLGHIERRSSWLKFRESLNYKSIEQYDMAYLFFREGYPRRYIAKLVGMHTSTIIKVISSQTINLDRRYPHGC